MYINAIDEIASTCTRFLLPTENVIVNHPCLEFIHVSTRVHLQRICNSVQQGLSRIQKKKKEQLVMQLDVCRTDITDTKEFVRLLSKILLILSKSEIELWKVHLSTHDNGGGHFEPTTVQAIQSFIESHDGMDMELKKEPKERVMRIFGKKTM